MRFLTTFLATATISLTYSGCITGMAKWWREWRSRNTSVHPTDSTRPRELSKLDECAHRIFESDDVEKRGMAKEAQRVLWDFNYGQDVVLEELRAKKDSKLHIHEGPPGKAPTGLDNGLFYFKWNHGKCMKLVAVMSTVAVEVLLSSQVPSYQGIGASVCQGGASTAEAAKSLGNPSLFNLISTDVGRAKKIDKGDFAALTVALIDIAKIITASHGSAGIICNAIWEGNEGEKEGLISSVETVDTDLKARVVLVYIQPNGDSSSVRSVGSTQDSVSSSALSPESQSVSLTKWRNRGLMIKLFEAFGLPGLLEITNNFGVDIDLGSLTVPVLLYGSKTPGVSDPNSTNQLILRESKDEACLKLLGYVLMGTKRVYTTTFVHDSGNRERFSKTCGNWKEEVATIPLVSSTISDYADIVDVVVRSIFAKFDKRQLEVKGMVMSDEPLH